MIVIIINNVGRGPDQKGEGERKKRGEGRKKLGKVWAVCVTQARCVPPFLELWAWAGGGVVSVSSEGLPPAVSGFETSDLKHYFHFKTLRFASGTRVTHAPCKTTLIPAESKERALIRFGPISKTQLKGSYTNTPCVCVAPFEHTHAHTNTDTHGTGAIYLCCV